MFTNEADFARHVANALAEAGYETLQECPVRTGRRIDILATKDDARLGIEVKFERRGILDDVSKSHQLLRLPEVDEMYVCGPMVFMNDDVRALADRLGIGLLAVRDTGDLEWLSKCRHLEPARLSLGGSYASSVVPGGEAIYSATVFNSGQKAAVDVEIRMVTAAPFVARYPSKAKAKRSLLEGQDQWTTTLVCDVKKGTRPGKYPLLLSLAAANVSREDSTIQFDVQPSKKAT